MPVLVFFSLKALQVEKLTIRQDSTPILGGRRPWIRENHSKIGGEQGWGNAKVEKQVRKFVLLIIVTSLLSRISWRERDGVTVYQGKPGFCVFKIYT